MSEPDEDFAAMFEASIKAKRYREGPDHRGHDRRDRSGGGVRRRRRQGRSHDRDRRTEGRRWRSRGRGRRPHSGDGGVDRGRADAVAEAGARRRDRPAARRRVPHRSSGGRQGRAGGQGRIRGAHRPAARLLPDVADRHRPDGPGGARRAASTQFRIIEYKEGGRNLVVSRRALLEEEQRASAAEVRRSIVAGAVMTGRVTSVREFGAFVDLGGGVQGLLHVSEMGWSRVSDTSQVVTPGEEITVKVLRVDDDKQKISLGLKQLTADPWSRVPRDLPGRPGAHRPRHAPRRVRGVRRARAGGRRRWRTPPRSRRPGRSEGWSTPGRPGDDGGVRDPEHRSREEADRRRAGAGRLGARRPGRRRRSLRSCRAPASRERSSVTRSSACSCSSRRDAPG